MTHIKRHTILLVLFFIVSFTDQTLGQSIGKKNFNSENKINELLRTEERALLKGDTLAAIQSMWSIAQTTSNMGDYGTSYDNYWSSLKLALQKNDSTYIPRIYTGIGVLYSVFGRDQEAEGYLNLALNFIKSKPYKTNNDRNALRNTYYVFASHNRENGDNGIAQKYIDTCETITVEGKLGSSALLTKAEKAYIYYNQNNYTEAIALSQSIEADILNRLPSYSVVLYSMMGSMYYATNDLPTCEHYLLKALSASETYKSHQNYLPDIYQKLGDLYLRKKEFSRAYSYLQRSKELTELLFDIRSKHNKAILEVKDAIRLEMEKREKARKQAKLNELEQNHKILFLRNLTLIILFISITIISILIIWNMHKRRKDERKSYAVQNAIKEKKNAEIVEVKNRELTSSALQLIQKDELILDIKNQLEALKSIDQKAAKSIISSIRVNMHHDWTEFQARFASVNKDFYNNLRTNYPELTAKDQKLCALIKLDFSSKEISQLLGISMESVNTARYRLRKKMRLTKEEELGEIIQRI